MTDLSISSSTVLLDCTLRDGGYYNDWDFPTSLVEKYLRAMSDAGIPVVELGFRFLELNSYAGPTAHTTDPYIEDLNVPADLKVCVMLNAKDLVSWEHGPKGAIDKLFVNSKRSRLDLVRIATTSSELTKLRPAIDRLGELGYPVGVNLMQIHSLTQAEISEFGHWCTDSQAVVAYFADSFGGLYPSDIERIVHSIRSGFEGPIGCHLHDNMSLAMANSLAAIDSGVTWIDATIRGMGRGPGNAQTEFLAVELKKRGLADVDLRPLLGLVSEDFAELQAKFRWGTNLYYLLSACNGVHPSYVQSLMTDPRYGAEDVISIIEQLGHSGGAKFSLNLATEASKESASSEPGNWDATNWCQGKHILIIGPGETTESHRDDIERFIVRNDLLVLNLNLTPHISQSLIDGYVVCNPVRALLDRRNLSVDDIPIFAPGPIASLMAEWQPNRQVYDYGFKVENGKFAVGPTICVLPHGLVCAYGLALALQGDASLISLVGIDGFNVSDPRQSEMIEVFSLFAEIPSAPSIQALTPSRYPIRASSLYSPEAS